MDIKISALQHLVAGLLLVISIPGHAATVYKTQDENGVVSFSDTPPENPADAEKLHIAAPPPQSVEEHQKNLEAMRESTDQMAADRREREKHRAQMRELQARTESYQAAAQPDYDYQDYSTIYTGSYNRTRYRRHHPPFRPGHRPVPVHPIARPPMRSSANVNPGSNSQLMRPMVSPRR